MIDTFTLSSRPRNVGRHAALSPKVGPKCFFHVTMWNRVGKHSSRVPVAITVTTTALAALRVSGVVWGDACVPGFGCGLARESVGGVGFEVGL